MTERIPFDFAKAGWKRRPEKDWPVRGAKALEAWVDERGHLVYIDPASNAFYAPGDIELTGNMTPPAPPTRGSQEWSD